MIGFTARSVRCTTDADSRIVFGTFGIRSSPSSGFPNQPSATVGLLSWIEVRTLLRSSAQIILILQAVARTLSGQSSLGDFSIPFASFMLPAQFGANQSMGLHFNAHSGDQISVYAFEIANSLRQQCTTVTDSNGQTLLARQCQGTNTSRILRSFTATNTGEHKLLLENNSAQNSKITVMIGCTGVCPGMPSEPQRTSGDRQSLKRLSDRHQRRHQFR